MPYLPFYADVDKKSLAKLKKQLSSKGPNNSQELSKAFLGAANPLLRARGASQDSACLNNGLTAAEQQGSVRFPSNCRTSSFSSPPLFQANRAAPASGDSQDGRRWKVCGKGGGRKESSTALIGKAVFHLQLLFDCYQQEASQQMTERKIWKVQEDLILKQLFEVRKIKKWSEISRVMQKSYGIEGRNGKQCRERYHNHLKGGIKKEKWSKEEENYLIELHALHGNRWALISKLIHGRTENCVKNMLYSKLRKAIRQLNRFSYQYYRKTLKEIKINFIYRLIEFTENSYKKAEQERTQQENMALDIKNQILQLDFDEEQPVPETQKHRIKLLVEQIHLFKRLNQRFRGNHASRNKGRKIVKVEEVDEDEQEEAKMQEESEKEEHMQAEQQREEAVEQPPFKVKEESKGSSEKTQDEPLMKGHDSHSTHVDEVSEAINHIRPKISIVRMDSLDSNLSLLLVDAGLQQPIQTEHQFFNLTPTPNHPGIIEDWNVLSNTWRNNFTFE